MFYTHNNEKTFPLFSLCIYIFFKYMIFFFKPFHFLPTGRRPGPNPGERQSAAAPLPPPPLHGHGAQCHSALHCAHPLRHPQIRTSQAAGRYVYRQQSGYRQGCFNCFSLTKIENISITNSDKFAV